VVHTGQHVLAWVERAARVISRVALSIAHVSRRSSVASGNKWTRMVVVCIETKAVSSSGGGRTSGTTPVPCAKGIHSVTHEFMDRRSISRYFRVSYHQKRP